MIFFNKYKNVYIAFIDLRDLTEDYYNRDTANNDRL